MKKIKKQAAPKSALKRVQKNPAARSPVRGTVKPIHVPTNPAEPCGALDAVDPTETPYVVGMGITQSTLAKFADCRVACRYSLDGWGTDAPKRSLQFGTLMHAMLEALYGAWHAPGGPDVMTTFGAVARAHEKAAAKAGDDPKAVQADLAQAKALFPAYVERWARDDAKRKWVEVEQVFDVRWNGHRLRGKVDGLFEAKDGSLWILETKTASRIDDETMSQALAFDFQSLYYCEAIEGKFGARGDGRKIAGVLYNVIRVPQIGKGDDRGSDAFLARLREDVAKRPDFYFMRYEVAFPAKTRERFRIDLAAKLDVFARWMANDEDEPTFRNEQACRKRWNCEYLGACACGQIGPASGHKRNRKLFSELAE
jgi:hypothetical protein